MRKVGKWLFGSTMIALWALILIVGSLSLGFFINRFFVQDTTVRKDISVHPTPSSTPLDPQQRVALVQQMNQIVQGQFTALGQQDVAVTYTSEQLEEMIATVGIPATENVQISCDDQGAITLQFKLGKDISELLTWIPSLKDYQGLLSLAQGSQVKIQGVLNWNQQDQLKLKLDTITLAGVAIPQSLVQTADQSLNKNLLTVLEKMEGFEVNKLEFHQDSVTFEGKVPTSIVLDQVTATP